MATPSRMEGPWPGVGDALSNYLERRVGGQTGDVGRAASATQAFLIFALVLASSYTVFFSVYDFEALRPVIYVGIGTVAGYVGALVLVRTGHQLTGAVLAVTFGTLQVAHATQYIGWIAGIQLYLIAGGQLVFMLFTQRQVLLRWAYLVVAVCAFFYCQLVVPEHGEAFSFSDSANGVLFSVNATLTLLLIYALAAISYYTAARVRAAADGAAARAEYLANTDELTGLSNRRPVVRRLDELSVSTRYAVAIADLDHFKALNDTFGHECGDRVLAVVGARLREGLRAGDSVGRWGGEEFIFVMADATLDDAVVTMERLRAELSAPVPCFGHSHDVRMSVGVTDAHPDGMAHRALQRADAALYEAKAAGRDTVHAIADVAPAPVPQPPQRRRRS